MEEVMKVKSLEDLAEWFLWWKSLLRIVLHAQSKRGENSSFLWSSISSANLGYSEDFLGF